jgi:uncharacterized protein (DUF302 family)
MFANPMNINEGIFREPNSSRWVNYPRKWELSPETEKLYVFVNQGAAAFPPPGIYFLLDTRFEICRGEWTYGCDPVYLSQEDKNMNSQNLGISIRLKINFDEAILRIKSALASEGFGILTEIDVKETMKKKLNIDYLPYRILGACNPGLANRAFTAAPEVGLLLPCNVTVRELEDSQIEISMIDPLVMMSVIKHPELTAVAEEVRNKFENIAARLESNKDA